MKLKVQNNTGGVGLASPLADLGVGPRVTVVEITGVPDDVTFQEEIALFEVTADVTWLKEARFSFDYGELGPGAIIRE